MVFRFRLNDFFDGGDETVATAGKGLDESRILRGVGKNFAKPHYRCIQTVIEIDESVARPKLTAQLLASHHFTRLFQKNRKNLERLFLKADPKAVFLEFTSSKIHGVSAETHTL